MKTKIGIITINGYYNYGNRLQNYALQRFLSKLSSNNVVHTIWHTKNNYKITNNNEIFSLKNSVKYLINWNGYRDNVQSNMFIYDYIKEYNLKKFSDRYIDTVFDYEVTADLNSKYDYFIVGSDQVWNPFFEDMQNRFLQFADTKKRIAYAASFGVTKIPEEKVDIFKNGLSAMSCISVREQAGADIIKELTGRCAPVLLDPTLLLNKSDYTTIMQKPAWYKEQKYILVYFLGEIPNKVHIQLQSLSKDNSLEIINIMDSSKIEYYTTTPEEFLFLLAKCSLMYTDSFHGAVFSIIMQVPFVICSRQILSEMNMDSRIDTLLSMLNLEHRRADANNNYFIDKPMKMAYHGVEDVLNAKRAEARQFLCSALGRTNEEEAE